MAQGQSLDFNLIVNADAEFKMDGIRQEANKLENRLKDIKLPPKLKGDFKDLFASLRSDMAKFERSLEGVQDERGVRNYINNLKQVERSYQDIVSTIQKLSKTRSSGNFARLFKDIDGKTGLEDAVDGYERAANNIKEVRQSLKKIDIGVDATKLLGSLDDLDRAQDEVQKLRNELETMARVEFGGMGIEKAVADLQDLNDTLDEAYRQSKKIGDALDEVGNQKPFKGQEEQFRKLEREFVDSLDWIRMLESAIQELDKVPMFEKATNDLNDFETQLKNLEQSFGREGLAQIHERQATRINRRQQDIIADLEKVETQAVDTGRTFETRIKGTEDKLDDFLTSTDRMNRDLDDLQGNLVHFFSLERVFEGFIDGARQALDVVRELDAAMTEIAVVTDYDLDEIWDMRGGYVDRATQLGAKTVDVVDASALYYQQGLPESQIMDATNETIKMARIGGLAGAEATDYMTSAIRGFNMEMSEAARVNDVYSEVAAVSASDTRELATAMSKTASIAHNSGAEFENITALLATAIETTREPPEAIGTAMKTIIARFQEMKKAPDEIGLVEGEIVDPNKMVTALRDVGIAAMDVNGEFRDFDDIMLEIAANWDTMSTMEQRYIATTAAGSRQQSRFIAMVQDYDHLMYLRERAYDSEGSGTRQYEKTLDSMESKMNSLTSQAELLSTHIFPADSITKPAISAATGFLKILNNILDVVPDIVKLFGAGGLAVGASRLAQTAVEGIFETLKATVREDGLSLMNAVVQTSNNMRRKQRRQAAEAANMTLINEDAIVGNVGGVITTLREKFAEAGGGAGKGFANNFASALRMVSNQVLGQRAAGGTLGALQGGAIIAGIVAALGALKLAIETIKFNSLDEQIKRTDRSISALTDSTNQTATRLKDLDSTRANYESMAAEVDNLVVGTNEWYQATTQINTRVMDLISQYSTLAKFVDVDSTGLMSIEAGGWKALEEDLKEQLSVQQTALTAQRIRATQLEDIQSARDHERDFYARLGAPPGGALITPNVHRYADPPNYKESLSAYSRHQEDMLKELAYNYDRDVADYSSRFQGYLDMMGADNAQEFEAVIDIIAEDIQVQQENLLERTSLLTAELTRNLREELDLAEGEELSPELASITQAAARNLADRDEVFVEEYNRQMRATRKGEFRSGPWGDAAKMEAALARETGAELEEIQSLYGGDKGRLREAIAVNRAQIQIQQDYADSVKELNAVMADSSNMTAMQEYIDTLSRMFSPGGMDLTFEDLDTIKGYGSFEDFIKQGIPEGLDPQLLADLFQFEDVNAMFEEAEKQAEYTKINMEGVLEKVSRQLENILGPELQSDLMKNLEGHTAGTAESVSDILLESYRKSGEEITQKLGGVMNQALQKLDTDGMEQFLTMLQNYDFSDASQLDEFRAGLAELGWVMSDVEFNHLVEELQSTQSAADRFSLQQLADEIDGILEMVHRINTGEQSNVFTGEEFADIVNYLGNAGAYEELGKFQLTNSGQYVYLGDSMSALRDAILMNTQRLYESRQAELDALMNAEQILTEERFDLGQGREVAGFDQLLAALQESRNFDESDRIFRELSGTLNKMEQILTPEQFSEVFGIQDATAFLEALVNADGKDREQMLNHLQDSYDQFMSESEDRSAQQQALIESQQIMQQQVVSELATSIAELIREGATEDEVRPGVERLAAEAQVDLGMTEEGNVLKHLLNRPDFGEIMQTPDFAAWIEGFATVRAQSERLRDSLIDNSEGLRTLMSDIQAEFDGLELSWGDEGPTEDVQRYVRELYDAINLATDDLLVDMEITPEDILGDPAQFEAFGQLVSAIMSGSIADAQRALVGLTGSSEAAFEFLTEKLGYEAEEAKQILRGITIDESQLEADVTVNTQAADYDIDSVRNKLQQFANEDYQGVVTVAVDEGTAPEEIRAIQQIADDLDLNVRIVTVDAEGNAAEEVSKVREEVDNLPAEKSTSLNVDGNADEAIDALDTTMTKREEVDGTTTTVTVDGDAAGANRTFNKVKTRSSDTEQLDPTVKFFGNAAQFHSVANQVRAITNSIDGRTATVSFRATHNFYQVQSRLNSLMATAGRARATGGLNVSRGGYATRMSSTVEPIMMMSTQTPIGDYTGPNYSNPIIGGITGPAQPMGPTLNDGGASLSGFARPISDAMAMGSGEGQASAGSPVMAVGGDASGGTSIGGYAAPITSMRFAPSSSRVGYGPIRLDNSGLPVSGTLKNDKQAKAQERSLKAQEAIAERNKVANEKAAEKAERIEEGQKYHEDNWENAVDRYYNRMRSVEKEIHKGNISAAQYHAMQNEVPLTIREMADNIWDQKTAIEQQQRNLYHLERARQTEVADAYAKFADVREYARMGDGYVVEINWPLIDRNKDEDVGRRITDYISELERIQDQIEKIQENQLDLKDQMFELKRLGKDQYLDLERQVMDALIAREEAALEEEEKSFDLMKDNFAMTKQANSNILKALRDGIREMRQQRQLDEDLENINEMERRLSLLQSDTSGATDLDIMKLQDQLQAARQSYTDSLIDQAIDKIDQGNEASAIQREQQLQIMEEQLDREIHSGELWDEAYAILSTALGKGDGVLPYLSEFLGAWQDVDSMSSLQKEEWGFELRSRIEEGFSWYLQAHDPKTLGYRGKTIEFQTPDGGTAKGKVDDDGNVTVGNTKYSGIYLNPEGRWVAEQKYVKPPAPPKPRPARTNQKPIKTGTKVKADPSASIYDWRDGRDPERQYYRGDPNYKVLRIVGEWVQLRWHKLTRGVTGWMKKADLKAYKEGGLVDYTGLAWVDGTKSKPESFLNARDTENFAHLANTLDSLSRRGMTGQTYGDINNEFYINIDEMTSREDAEMMMDIIERRITESAGYRNVNTLRFKR